MPSSLENWHDSSKRTTPSASNDTAQKTINYLRQQIATLAIEQSQKDLDQEHDETKNP